MHDDELAKIQEATLQIEKQACKLNAKSEEIAETRQLYEDVKARLHEKESILHHVSSANEKLQIDCGEKVEKLEVENRKLVSALDELTTRTAELERKFCACNVKIEVLENLLSDLLRKGLEKGQKAQATKALRQKDDDTLRLEEQSTKIQEELKWKTQQFEQLRDAHKQLQDQFQSSKEEWTNEKSALLGEMYSLQTSLDTQSRTNESLHVQLKMCNQDMTHEESRRKALELQLLESKQCFENVLADLLEAKTKIETLAVKREEEIEAWKSSQGMRETLLKTEYRIAHLEKENQEILLSVKELQEAQIYKRRPDPLLTKLRKELKDLEQVHSSCAVILKEREAEWTTKMEEATGAMNNNEADSKRQNEKTHHLKMQLDSCYSSMEILGEEILILFMYLKPEFSEAYSKVLNLESQIGACNIERREKMTLASEQLEMEHSSPVKAQIDREAHEEIASPAQKLESFKLLEENSTVLEKELEKHKEMLEESLDIQLRSEEQVMLMEAALKNASDALEKSNSELAIRICEASQTEAELQMWKSKAESMNTCFEQNQEICNRMETYLLAQAEIEQYLNKESENLLFRLEDQDQALNCLQQQIILLDQTLVNKEEYIEAMKSDAREARKKEEHYEQIIEERNIFIKNIQKEIACLEQEFMRRQSAAVNLARFEAEKTFEQEKEKLQINAAEKDKRIEGLQILALSLEQKFADAVFYSFSEIVEKLVEVDVFKEALEKSEYQMNLEIQEKNRIICHLQKEVADLHDKLMLQAESFFHSKQAAKKQELLLENKQKEMETLKDKYENEHAKLKKLVTELEFTKDSMLENINVLHSERENLLVYVEGICEQIGDFCVEDKKLVSIFGQMSRNCEGDDGFARENGDVTCMRKDVKGSIDGRSPLQELNN
ncbi:hypothetical protein Nepgr_018243 [Nepenthes gracilis]|uniref:Uncharacterized protein n=1 Tax=Nepenthes gracilis TaxID=150966 RepID=A0AAD3SSL1_NEPGR|nr:hypothetical protein Nepgr_018243 [Nepenthes gracilis]